MKLCKKSTLHELLQSLVHVKNPLSLSLSLSSSSDKTSLKLGTSPRSTACFFSVTNLVRTLALSSLLLSIFSVSFLTTYAATAPVTTKIGVTNTKIVKNGLVGHWTFDGKHMTNATATDASGQGNHGTLTNMTTRSSATPGKTGQGLKFDGVDDFINLGTGTLGLSSGISAFSVSSWVKLSSFGTENAYPVIIGKSSSTSPYGGWQLNTNTDSGSNKFDCAANISGTWSSLIINGSGSQNYETNKWYNVVCVYNGSTFTLYVNGTVDATASVPGTLQHQNVGASMYIGKNPAFPSVVRGTIDDVRVYNRALSALEVKSLYKAGGGVTIKPTSPNIATIIPRASFTCGVSTVSDVDGNVYNTVSAGSQCWMKQSLRTGTRISAATTQTNNGIIEKHCYSNSDANCTSNNPNQPDGGLYQWNEAMQYSTTPGAKGICPTGWHIPTHDQLTTMERNICTSGSCVTDFPYDTSTTGYRGTDEGTKLKPNGTSALEVNLAGSSYSGSFYNRGTFGILWSSSESGANAWYRYVVSGSAQVHRSANDKSFGLSVRCLKD